MQSGSPVLNIVIGGAYGLDEEIISKIYKRVEACREWLKEFDFMHSNINNILQ